MTSWIDHASEAQRLLRESDKVVAQVVGEMKNSLEEDATETEILFKAVERGRQNAAAKAQVHATLALAEQQRIANLIALATGAHAYDGMARRASDRGHNALVTDPNGDLDPAIAAALGIEDIK